MKNELKNFEIPPPFDVEGETGDIVEIARVWLRDGVPAASYCPQQINPDGLARIATTIVYGMLRSHFAILVDEQHAAYSAAFMDAFYSYMNDPPFPINEKWRFVETGKKE